MNALKCEGPSCKVWAWPDENDGWLSLSRADWPEGGGRWEGGGGHYFHALACLGEYIQQEDRVRRTIVHDVEADEAANA